MNSYRSLFLIPNLISLFRIACFPFLITSIITKAEGYFTILIILCLVSDLLDGLLARLLKQETKIGAVLDSIGDIGTFIAGAAGLFVFKPVFISVHIWEVLAVLSLYLIEMVISLIKFGKISSFHTYLSKVAAYFLGVFVGWLFLFEYNSWLFYSAVCVSVIAYTEEIIIALQADKANINVKGLWWLYRKDSKKNTNGQ